MPLTLDRLPPTPLRVTRRFDVPPERLWAAPMEPALLRRWLLGPDGWSMTLCESDPRPGGRIRYE